MAVKKPQIWCNVYFGNNLSQAMFAAMERDFAQLDNAQLGADTRPREAAPS